MAQLTPGPNSKSYDLTKKCPECLTELNYPRDFEDIGRNPPPGRPIEPGGRRLGGKRKNKKRTIMKRMSKKVYKTRKNTK
jgi:hypothetical protein